MLRLESYVAPFLTSYLKRYIRNLTSEDLKLSIWGGDVVLTNLELKLDILESELNLPFAWCPFVLFVPFVPMAFKCVC